MVDHLSYSSCDTYLVCPKKWWHRYVNKTPIPPNPNLLFGSAFHTAVEDHAVNYRENIALAWRWYQAWNGIAGELDLYVILENMALGAAMCAHQPTIDLVERLNPVDVERKVEFEVPGVPVPVIGYIDVVTRNTLIDFKTSGRAWEPGWAKNENQPAFYLYATGARRFRHVVFVKTWKPQVQTFDNEWPNAKEIVVPMVQNVWKGIAAGDFQCNLESCRWCDYQDVCDKGMEVY